MRITFLLPTLGMSGGIRVVAIYAKWLAQQGHDVLLISQAAKAPGWKNQFKNLLLGKGWLKHKSVPASHFDGLNLKHGVVEAGCIPGPDLVPPADVLVSTWWETAEWAMQLPADRGAKVYFVQGHEVFDHLPRERCEATYRLPLHKIVVAQWLKNLMRDKYGDAVVDLVPNSVDHDLFFATEREKQMVPTLGFLYSEVTIKGTDIALKVAEFLKKKYPDLVVLAFGSEPTSKFLVPDFANVYIAPHQNKIRDLYASCDVWLSTSRTEGFNLMAMEAMACRTPVVSTRTGWPVEAIQDGVNGYLVDIDDVPAAVEAVSRVLSLDAEGWRTMSEQAYATAKSTNWESSCQRFEQALVQACVRAKAGDIAGSQPVFEAR